jgi:hypothetical protein
MVINDRNGMSEFHLQYLQISFYFVVYNKILIYVWIWILSIVGTTRQKCPSNEVISVGGLVHSIHGAYRTPYRERLKMLLGHARGVSTSSPTALSASLLAGEENKVLQPSFTHLVWTAEVDV